MPRKGILWNYFSVFDKHAKKAKCNYCQKALSYKTTITNLKNHLKQKHIFIYEEVCSIEKNRNKNGGLIIFCLTMFYFFNFSLIYKSNTQGRLGPKCDYVRDGCGFNSGGNN